MGNTRWTVPLAVLLAILSAAATCGTQTSGNIQLWTEQEVWFEANNHLLYGVLCMPPADGPHPAIILITGAINSTSSRVDGANAPTLVQHAHRLATQGFATLRFDPAGVGQSEGDGTIRTLDMRMTEAVDAVSFVQSQSSIRAERVGLWGVSQGGWVIAMAAAQAPEQVAFLIMVSGTTISVAEQQVYGVETQASAAELPEEDVAKAVVVMQLLIDWQISKPIFTTAYEEAVQTLGSGPWEDLYAIVHTPGDLTAAKQLTAVIEVLELIQDEPWTQSLYLRDMYLPSLRSIPPEQAGVAGAAMEASLLASPRAYFTKVSCPMLALFGEDDVHLPAQRSAESLREYAAEGENSDLTVVIFENTGHSMNNFMSAYWDQLDAWLGGLYE
ncbi:alpha/beta fold hydrolase [Candidatus Bipolaricaulota bacterium]